MHDEGGLAPGASSPTQARVARFDKHDDDWEPRGLPRLQAALDELAVELDLLAVDVRVQAKGDVWRLMAGPLSNGSSAASRHTLTLSTRAARAEATVVSASALPLHTLRALACCLGHLLDGELERRDDLRGLHEALHEARRDPLTGLGNRRHWEQAMVRESSRARRMGRALALVVLDLDGLKQVNDAGGHEAGDALLRRTADVLSAQRRITDTACRLGGDEFGLLGLVRDEQEAQLLGTRLLGELREAGVDVSVGTAVAQGDLSEADLVHLWRQADERMYIHKRG